ncbi:MAG: ABC-type polysaccharide/polyol phosphate export system, permease component [Gammaproteobacteria bacterium]|jgi:lipopolysaccharide transport system permease protein|nr:ABC-type polysaccharide/polyol phosphate export system, permease component [Gammaproteobacteria bacterium]
MSASQLFTRQGLELIKQMTVREIQGRYRGSFIGLFWSFLIPIIMLLVYTFVFSVVFKARWGVGGDVGHGKFAINLFAGMMVYNFFSEVISRSPMLILNNRNFVKKMVFPLEIFSIATTFNALFHFFISLFIFAVFFLFLNHYLCWTIIFIPLIILPFFCLTLGISCLLAGAGLLLRDINYIINVILTILMFFAPIFYPVSMLPAALQHLVYLNPLTLIVEEARQVLVLGVMPDWKLWIINTIISVAVLICSYLLFEKMRRVFADVI